MNGANEDEFERSANGIKKRIYIYKSNNTCNTNNEHECKNKYKGYVKKSIKLVSASGNQWKLDFNKLCIVRYIKAHANATLRMRYRKSRVSRGYTNKRMEYTCRFNYGSRGA